MSDLGWCWVYGFKVVTDSRPEVKHRPILFSGPMVRAILEGRKTQTRRPLKPAPTLRDRVWSWAASRRGEGATWAESITRGLERMLRRWSPFGQVGERLWVRETWAYFGGDEYLYLQEPGSVQYRATATELEPIAGGRWRPAIHMQRWASRLTLEIESVRVERVEAISEEDARAEGVDFRESFLSLWRSIYGAPPTTSRRRRR